MKREHKEYVLKNIDKKSIKEIAAGAYREKTIDGIRGSGYVVRSLRP